MSDRVVAMDGGLPYGARGDTTATFPKLDAEHAELLGNLFPAQEPHRDLRRATTAAHIRTR